MTTYQDRARLLFDKFYTDRKHEYDKFSEGKISAETFKSNSKYLLDQALSELASIVEEELLPKERPVKPRQSGQDAKQLINLGYNTAIQEIRGKFKEPQR